VNSLYSVYLGGMDGFEDKYLQMLSSGGSMRHKELLSPFGINATHLNFWQKGIDIIGDFITELEK